MDSNRPGLGEERPSLVHKGTSSRRLVDFDSEQLLSMEEIRDNVRLTASRLLNDDLDSSDEEAYDDEHDQLPHPEDARLYAGRLLKKDRSMRMEKQQSMRKPMNIMRSIQAMKDMRGRSDADFSSDVDDLAMEMDMHEQMPRNKRTSKHKLYCMAGTLVLVAICATILVFFSKGSSDDGGSGGGSPSSSTSVNSSPPQVKAPPPQQTQDASPRMERIIDMLVQMGVSDAEALNTDGTAQRLAVEWIANEDALQYDPYDDESRLIQRYAITVMYYALNGPEWKHQLNFLAPEEECTWFQDIPAHKVDDVYSVGITCNGYLQVETILLPVNNLVGSLPSELSVLKALDFVSLKHNKITGSIPDSFKALSNIEWLDLQYNQMTGTLPSWLGDSMASLRDLSLSDNQFEGQLPQSMLNMKHLNTLAIDDNSFTGDMSSVVNGLDSLKYIYADNNMFDSKIDFNFLAESINLEEVDLSGNMFTSDGLPLHFFLMKNLRVLDLHDNAMEGPLFDDIPTQDNLRFLSLYGNSLSGTIPETIRQLNGLTHLDLSRNSFTGSPPDTISYLEDLRYLYLSDNPFDPGEIPLFYQDLSGLEEFSMAKAMRTGTIPDWLEQFDSLMLLDLSENELTGSIPDLIFDLPNLRFLLLHRNQLTGAIEDGILRADKLDMLTTDKNQIEDDWTRVCELGRPEFLSADCGGNFEKVYCTCCTVCCEESNPECNDEIVLANLDARWETNFTRSSYNFGPNSIFEGDAADEAESGGAERKARQ